MGLFVVEVAEAWPGVRPQAPPPTWCPWRPGCSWAPPVGRVGSGLGAGPPRRTRPQAQVEEAEARVQHGAPGPHLDRTSEWRSVLGSCLQTTMPRGGRRARAHLRPRPAGTCVLRPALSLACLVLWSVRGHTPAAHTVAWLGPERREKPPGEVWREPRCVDGVRTSWREPRCGDGARTSWKGGPGAFP